MAAAERIGRFIDIVVSDSWLCWARRNPGPRAAEQAAAGLPPGTPLPTPPGTAVSAPNMPPVPVGDPNSGDPRWQSVYQRYQQPRAK